MRLRHLLSIALLVASIGYVATPQAAQMVGEAPAGTQKGLGGIGIPVSWSNPNSVLYTCTNPNGFVALHIVPRNPVGTQPLTYSISVVPGGSPVSYTTASAIVNNVISLVSNSVVTGNMGQSIVVTPLAPTTGSLTFDLLGYEGI